MTSLCRGRACRAPVFIEEDFASEDYRLTPPITAPLHVASLTNGSGAAYFYTNNIQSDPQFISKDESDWRLIKESPCVDAGTNEDWMNGAVDLDGRSRIDRFSGVVDMGCYEYVPSGVIISVP